MSVVHRYSKRAWSRAVCLMLSLSTCIMLGLAACQTAAPLTPDPTGESIPDSLTPAAAPTQAPSPTPTGAPLQSPTPEMTSTPALAPDPTGSPTPTPVFYEPAGCWQPPDDYTQVSINGYTLNTRTYAMLQQADLLYDGEIDVAGKAIIQGSYSNDHPDEPGAHLGGGAVDISVVRPDTQYIPYTELEPLIRALRTVGFAAWLREGAMEPGPGMYIHAIAIGDSNLSPAAQEQLSGPAGYLRGYDGLPAASGDPGPDRHGGPLVCRWMLEAGYSDMRTPTPAPTPGPPWQERLRQASLAYVADYPEDAAEVAVGLNFLDGRSESAENICGPLAAAILRDAGLLPDQPGPVQELKWYWQSRPSTNGRPWSLFSERDYEVFRFDTPLSDFDFSAWPLQPADFVYTYAKGSGFEHMFIVTEVDPEGRAYTVTNQNQSWGNWLWGSFLIQRYMLYDPNDPSAGIIANQWSDRSLGMTGHGGFEVMRKRGLQAGTLYEYTVRPGDTLPDLAARFGATPESLVQANPDVDLANLQIGQLLTIPIPPYSPETPAPGQGEVP